MTAFDSDTWDVAIIGAGPVGAGLAGELGRWGIRTVVVEAGDGQFKDPRMHAVNVRSMELLRRWGLTARMRTCGWPLDHPQDIVFLTSLRGHEVGRIPWLPIADCQPEAASPTFAQRCPQSWFNPIMHEFARDHGVPILWNTVAENLDDDGELVTISTRSAESGAPGRIKARFVVGCDGARSFVRTRLGIERDQTDVYGFSAETIVKSTELARLVREANGGRFTKIDPIGISASLLPFDGRDLFRITLMAEQETVTEDRMHKAIRSIAGGDLDFTMITPVLPWVNREAIAKEFIRGRILIAGDAAHTMPPTGGFGYNTGVLDALDLGWKLAATLKGWGGPALLNSYNWERKRAATRTAAMAGSIYREWFRVAPILRDAHPELAEDGSAGEAARSAIGKMLIQTFRFEFNAVGAALGYNYYGSPVIFSDGSDAPLDDIARYEPTGRPGHLAPHFWLTADCSVRDLFDRNFTLIGFRPHRKDAWSGAAAKRGIPLLIVDGPEAMEGLYGAPLSLVRPDGHVAWRGEERAADPDVILASVTGHGPVAAE